MQNFLRRVASRVVHPLASPAVLPVRREALGDFCFFPEKPMPRCLIRSPQYFDVCDTRVAGVVGVKNGGAGRGYMQITSMSLGPHLDLTVGLGDFEIRLVAQEENQGRGIDGRVDAADADATGASARQTQR